MRLPFNGTYKKTQGFGENPQDYAQFGMIGHNGNDYGLPTSTPVVAATSGTVRVLSDPPGFGNYIEIYGTEYKTVYAHLLHATVQDGQYVNEGDQIALSDNTGNSSGPHLHFGVKPIVGRDDNNGYFGAIDPEPILNQGDDDMTADQDSVLRDIQGNVKDARKEATDRYIALESRVAKLEKILVGDDGKLKGVTRSEIPLVDRVEDVKDTARDKGDAVLAALKK